MDVIIYQSKPYMICWGLLRIPSHSFNLVSWRWYRLFMNQHYLWWSVIPSNKELGQIKIPHLLMLHSVSIQENGHFDSIYMYQIVSTIALRTKISTIFKYNIYLYYARKILLWRLRLKYSLEWPINIFCN